MKRYCNGSVGDLRPFIRYFLLLANEHVESYLLISLIQRLFLKSRY